MQVEADDEGEQLTVVAAEGVGRTLNAGLLA
jgi:hypothetical protein